MILRELMREKLEVVHLTEQARLSQVADLMRDRRVGSVVIVDDSEHVVGMITDRDIALSLALGAATPDSFVSEVMSREVDCVSSSMNLFDVTRFFKTVEVKRLPVIDESKRLVGIVSMDDVMALLAREMFDTCSALEPKLGHMV